MTNQSGGSGAPSGVAGGALTGTYPAPSINTVTAVLGADVPLTVANTFVDVLTAALSAGTWLLVAKAEMVTGATQGTFTARLTDGTTVYGVSSARAVAVTVFGSLVVCAVAVLAAPATMHFACTADVTGCSIHAMGDANGQVAVATQLIAVKVA